MKENIFIQYASANLTTKQREKVFFKYDLYKEADYSEVSKITEVELTDESMDYDEIDIIVSDLINDLISFSDSCNKVVVYFNIDHVINSMFFRAIGEENWLNLKSIVFIGFRGKEIFEIE